MNAELKNAVTATDKKAQYDERYELHRLLGALLSKELTIDEKLNIIGRNTIFLLRITLERM